MEINTNTNSNKRLAFSGAFMSQRRKVVSGFSLGVGASLFFLTLLFLNSSPKVQVFLQGSGSNTSNASFPSWPFPFITYPFSPSSSVSSLQRVEQGTKTETPEVNASGEGLEKAQLGDLSVDRDNATLHGEEKRFPQKNHVGNGSLVIKNGNFSGTNDDDDNKNNGVVKDVGFLAEQRGIDANASVAGEGKVVAVQKGELHNGSLDEELKVDFRGDCDIYDGKWVRDDSKPYYPLGSCPYIDRDFDCHFNGRPDSEYVKWRWQPNGCDIPSLNATDFLERLRGQKLVFVGDSLNRNMWESMVCILRQSVGDKKRVFEISGRHEFKKKGFYAFRFEDYNCSVDFVSSPFIVRESTFKGINGSFETLRLDLMDQTTTMYHDADIIVFNTGHWWTHEKTSKGEDYYQEGNHVYPRLKVLNAYRRALTTWARWIDKNIDANRTQVIFRGYSVTHFRGGQWNSGGQCHKETEPIFNGTHLRKYPSKMRALDYVIPNMKTPVIYMNISRLTDYRKDGHPSIYRMEYKTEAERASAELHQDCSHWCLPGVPDTWNELLYASLLKHGKGNWIN